MSDFIMLDNVTGQNKITLKIKRADNATLTAGGMFCLCWRSLRSHGAIFAHRGAARMFLFECQTIAPLRKSCWGLQIYLFILRVMGTMQKLWQTNKIYRPVGVSLLFIKLFNRSRNFHSFWVIHWNKGNWINNPSFNLYSQ